MRHLSPAVGAFLPTVSALALLACGASGPPLPDDIGASHASTSGGARGTREPVETAPAEPVPVGTIVWANFRDAGFFFHGVVVEQRGATHRVIYDDGESEWVAASALLPDSLGEGAEVHVRTEHGERFSAATIERRAGRALYVHYGAGGEGWTSIAHVRFAASDPGAPRRGASAVAASPEIEVLAEYHGQGLRFGATVTARREDGAAHVVYLDGDTEWTSAIAADEVRAGSVLHVRRTWEPPQWLEGRVEERLGDALRVTLEDGGTAWTSMFRIRVPVVPGS